MDEPRETVAKLRNERPEIIDALVARLLKQTGDHGWRARFVTELRVQKVWPESERGRSRTQGC